MHAQIDVILSTRVDPECQGPRTLSRRPALIKVSVSPCHRADLAEANVSRAGGNVIIILCSNYSQATQSQQLTSVEAVRQRRTGLPVCRAAQASTDY